MTCGFRDAASRPVLSAAIRLAPLYLRSVLTASFFDELAAEWDRDTGALGEAITEYHPVALNGISSSQGGGIQDPHNILRAATFESLRRAHRSFPPEIKSAVLDVVGELDSFLHSDSVEVEVFAELLGLHIPDPAVDALAFENPPQLAIVRLDQTLARRFGIDLTSSIYGFPRLVGACAIHGHAILPLRFGSQYEQGPTPALPSLFDAVDTLILALQVTHQSSLGTPIILTQPTSFGLCIGMHLRQFRDSPRPSFGTLEITRIDSIRKTYTGLRSQPHPAMRLACSRLGMSRMRIDPGQAILDAVMGLEAILLFGTGQKTELRHRFALHYALLCPDSGRRVVRAEVAKAAYDLRSSVVHGGALDSHLLNKLSDGSSPLLAALKIQGMLHECIELFENDFSNPLFASKGYWQRIELGIP